MSGLRVVFFGMEGLFSRAPLAALLAAGHEVCGVVVPRLAGVSGLGQPVRIIAPPARRPHDLRLLARHDEQTIIGMAWERGIPVLEVGRLPHEDTLAALRGLRPDALCVACFPRLLPPVLLEVARHGALNVHPSLLPQYRGPAPLFWVFHDGLERAGVTIHLMDATADTGDIVAQSPVRLADGIGYSAAERICAEEGGRLLVDALGAMASGTLVRRPQPGGPFPSAPVPADRDFVITPAWPARRAFNFVRGLAEWERPILIVAGHERFIVREAVSFDEAARMSEPIQHHGDRIAVQCSPGTLTITGAEPIRHAGL